MSQDCGGYDYEDAGFQHAVNLLEGIDRNEDAAVDKLMRDAIDAVLDDIEEATREDAIEALHAFIVVLISGANFSGLIPD